MLYTCVDFSVYPQKQQYAYAGYPTAAAYPGPYYHGSQYGPYNYWTLGCDKESTNLINLIEMYQESTWTAHLEWIKCNHT